MSNHFQEIQLKDICQVKGGKRLPAGTSFADGQTPYPYLRVIDMRNGTIDDSSLVYITEEVERKIKKYKISKDDLYVTIAGTLGLFGSIPNSLDNAQLTENAAKLTAIDTIKISKDFLKFYLNSNAAQSQINREIGIGGGVPKLALYRLERLRLKIPPLTHQRKIAHILSTCDRVIKKTEAAIAKYEALKQGLMQDLFTRGIDVETGALRPPWEEAPELYDNKKLRGIPKAWKIEKLGNLGAFTKGWNIPKYILSPEGKGCILYGQLYTRYNNIIDKVETRFPFELATQLRPLKKGSILFAGSGETHEEIGKSAAFMLNEEVYAGGDIVIFDPNPSCYSPFLGYLLNHHSIQRQKAKLGQGSSVIHIYANHLSSIEIAFPTYEEQTLIYDKIKTLEEKIRNEAANLSKYRRLKDGLMQDLLTGRVEVQLEEGHQA